MIRSALMTAAVLLPAAAFAAGSGSDTAPSPSDAAAACMKLGKVLASDGKTCVAPSSGALDDAALYQAARESAYSGRYGLTLDVLDAMPDQRDDRVLTYRGFVERKLGNLDAAKVFYEAALAANPDNILARSYMGQGLVAEGDFLAARAQLIEIRARGGAGSWAEASLADAIATGATYNY